MVGNEAQWVSEKRRKTDRSKGTQRLFGTTALRDSGRILESQGVLSKDTPIRMNVSVSVFGADDDQNDPGPKPDRAQDRGQRDRLFYLLCGLERTNLEDLLAGGVRNALVS